MYGLGLKALKRICTEQDKLVWHRAKLTPNLFVPAELPVFEWVRQHIKDHHVLPSPDTLSSKFPTVQQFDTPEPVSYYIQLLEFAYYKQRISDANVASQQILKENQNNYQASLAQLSNCIRDITFQKYRHRILDVGKESAQLVLQAYSGESEIQKLGMFGWPYMDDQTGGVMEGDVVSFVGRPASGKTWLTLWTALTNWKQGTNVLFVSMEMTILPIAQRIVSLYTGSTISQLKNAEFSTQTFTKFIQSLKVMSTEKGKFYVIDGNLASTVPEIYLLADMLECQIVVFDGGYLVKHENKKLDRFNRAAENVELMKLYTTDFRKATFASWQFNRKASDKKKEGETGGLEDIGYTDAIGQISAVVCGLFQEEGIETMKTRKIKVLKGRNGEIGQFSIEWDFNNMSFKQCDPPLEGQQNQEEGELKWI
jgi:replicative DNA helicase